MAKMLASEILCFPKQMLGGKFLVNNGVAWRPVTHTSAAQ